MSGTRLGRVGAAILLLFILAAVFAPVLARHDPTRRTAEPFEAPSLDHPLGANDVGQDILSELLFAGRLSLTVGISTAALAAVLGVTVGVVSGYVRGPVDSVMMRSVDAILSLPSLPLMIVLAAFLGQNTTNLILVIGLLIWARPARLIRSRVLSVRESGHVQAARAMGAPHHYVMARHILSRMTPLIAAQFVWAANVSIMLEASLAFLGLGDPLQKSWGAMLFYANSRSAFLTDAWLWWVVPPGLCIAAVVVSFAFLGYWLEERADPRLRPPLPIGAPLVRPACQGGGAPVSALLEVRGVSTIYRTPAGPVRAVDGVDLTVGRGEVLGVVGESGSGKTTLAMSLMRLVKPPGRILEGSVRLGGEDLFRLRRAEMPARRGRDLAFIPQNAMRALNPVIPVDRQVAEAITAHRGVRRGVALNAAREKLEEVGIPSERLAAYPHELSGGMRQRVVIAMAVANEPKLLIADEPTSGLDVVVQARILRLILALVGQHNLSMIFVSHDLPTVARVCDRIAVMYAGRIVEVGDARDVLEGPLHPYTRALVEAVPRLHGPGRDLRSILGDPPNLHRPPPGCSFHPRCPAAFADCPRIDPPLEEVKPGRQAACLLHQR